MTTDIVERLRLHPSDIGGPGWMDMVRERAEAADTIERLRAEVEALRARVRHLEDAEVARVLPVIRAGAITDEHMAPQEHTNGR